MPSDFDDLLPDSQPIHREATEDARVARDKIPAKGAVYLLTCNEEGADIEKPMLLATVGDLRSALRRRLGELPPDAKTKRVPYGRLCANVRFRRVDSSFAANFWYAQAARRLFPETYAALIPWRTTWWIAMESEGPFPRLRKTNALHDPALRYAGPVRDKHAAARLIESIEDLFDLCRYYSELVQAPHGKPCAYKEMGKCPAPCDGSVPIAWYRTQSDRAWAFLSGASRHAWRTQTESDMKAAATRLEFETAARIKQRLTRAAQVDADPFAHVRSLDSFSFIALQPGRGKPWIEPWLIHGPHIECLPQINKKNLAVGIDSTLARFRELTQTPIAPPLDPLATEHIALISHHLYRGHNEHGLYLHHSRLAADPPAVLAEAAHQLWQRKATPAPLVEQSSEPVDSAPPPHQPTPAPPAASPTPEISPPIAPSADTQAGLFKDPA